MKNILWTVLIIALLVFAGISWRSEHSDAAIADAQKMATSQLKTQPALTKSVSTAQPQLNNPNDHSDRPGVKSRDFTSSIEGIDANRNGVRDDIENYIYRTYSNIDQRQAMMQYAKAVTQVLLSPDISKKAMEVATRNEFRSFKCLQKFFPGETWANNAKELLAMHLNTRQRFMNYGRFMNKGGFGIGQFEGNPCDELDLQEK